MVYIEPSDEEKARKMQGEVENIDTVNRGGQYVKKRVVNDGKSLKGARRQPQAYIVEQRPNRKFVGKTVHDPLVPVDDETQIVVAPEYNAAVVMDERKRRAESLAWDALEAQLSKGDETPPSLIEMVLKPKHFPNVKISLTKSLDSMNNNDLLDYMDGLVHGNQ